jgi:hypothetical protein
MTRNNREKPGGLRASYTAGLSLTGLMEELSTQLSLFYQVIWLSRPPQQGLKRSYCSLGEALDDQGVEGVSSWFVGRRWYREGSCITLPLVSAALYLPYCEAFYHIGSNFSIMSDTAKE